MPLTLNIRSSFWSSRCSYLESDKQESHIRPWFWIALFFFGRLLKDISDQWFVYHQVRIIAGSTWYIGAEEHAVYSRASVCVSKQFSRSSCSSMPCGYA